MPSLPASVRFLLTGRWQEHEVRVAMVPTSRRIVPDVETLIDQAWAHTTARPGVNLFDGPVCRLESFGVDEDGTLLIDVSRTTYRINVGTNFVNPHLADDHGPDVMANPLGVSAGLISCDGFLMLGRRNGSVAYYPHMLHPFAGSLEVRERINLFDDARRELREELAFTPDDVASIELIGIVEDRQLRHPETIFLVHSTRTHDQVQRQVDAAEHGSSDATPWTRAGLASLLERDDVTPVGKSIAYRLLELSECV